MKHREYRAEPMGMSGLEHVDDYQKSHPEQSIKEELKAIDLDADRVESKVLVDADKLNPDFEKKEQLAPVVKEFEDIVSLGEWRKAMRDWSEEYFARHPSIGGTDRFREIFSAFFREVVNPGYRRKAWTLEEQVDAQAPEDWGRKTYLHRGYPSVRGPEELDPERVIELRTGRAGALEPNPYHNHFAERIFGLRATDSANKWQYEHHEIFGEKGSIPDDLGSFYLAAEMAEAWSKDVAVVLDAHEEQRSYPVGEGLANKPIAPIRDVPSPALERVNEKHFLRMFKVQQEIRESVKDLKEIRDQKGERAMLEALVDRFYNKTRHVDGKNSLLEIFSVSAEEAQADCEGKAKGMAVLLEQIYLGSDSSYYAPIKFEFFDKHLRLLFKEGGEYDKNGIPANGATYVLEGEVKKWEPTPGTAVVKAHELRNHLLFGYPLPLRIESDSTEQIEAQSDFHEGYGHGGTGESTQREQKFEISGVPVQGQKSTVERDMKKSSEIATLRIPSVLKSYDGGYTATGAEGRITASLNARAVEPAMLPEESMVGPLLMSIKQRLQYTSREFWEGLKGSLSDLKGSMEGVRLRKEYALAALITVQGVSPDEAACVGIDVADAAMAATSEAYNDTTSWSVEEIQKRAANPDFESQQTNLYDKKLAEHWKTHFDSIDYIVSREAADVEVGTRPQEVHITPGLEERFVTEGFWHLAEKQGMRVVEFLSPDLKHPLAIEEITQDLPESLRNNEQFKILVDGKE